MNKKGVVPLVPITITVGLILAFALLVRVTFGGIAGLLFLLAKYSIFLIGGTIAVFGGLILWRAPKNNLGLIIVSIGVGMILFGIFRDLITGLL